MSAKYPWYASLRVTYGFVLASAVLGTSIMLTGLSYLNAKSNMLDVSHTFLGQVSEVTYQRTEAFLDEPRIVNLTTVRDLRNGLIGLDNPDALEIYFYDALFVHEGTHQINYADVNGNFMMVKRNEDGSLSTKRIWHEEITTQPSDPALPPVVTTERHSTWTHREAGAGIKEHKRVVKDPTDTYDPRTRAWFKGAVRTGELFWTDAYVFYTDKTPGITVAMPDFDDGELRGVTSVDIGLSDFSSFLSALSIGDNGSAFLVDHRGRLIAGPDPDDLILKMEGEGGTSFELHTVEHSTVQQMVDISKTKDFRDVMSDISASSLRTLQFHSEGANWVGAVRPIRIAPGREWLIVVVAAEDDFLGEIKKHNRLNLMMAFLLVLLALGMSMALSRWLSRSLQKLVQESKYIADLEFDSPVQVSSQFKEIHDVLTAFDSMKTGLRAFQKYMPLKLVRILLEKHEEPQLGSENQIVTIWFSDIAGFSLVSERLAPQEMATNLGHYLSSLTQVIEGKEGTVVQYVGDEIFALFNAPLPVTHHARLACQAVLACRDVVNTTYDGEGGLVALPTRFALHTTEVAVGHFGSNERLYYGAVGDGVNLTSRLEGANKQYGTEIIISEHTWALVSEHFESRRLDDLIVKGRTGAIGIYELLGHNGQVKNELLQARDAYEAALDHYAAQEWEKGIASCNESLALRPHDRAAEQLSKRCQKYLQRGAVEDGWTAAFKMETK